MKDANETKRKLLKVTDQIADLNGRHLALEGLRMEISSQRAMEAIEMALSEIKNKLQPLMAAQDELREKYDLERVMAIWPGTE